MNFTYEQRPSVDPRSTVRHVPEHGSMNPITALLVEFYRRAARFDEPRVARIPPTPDRLLAWFARHLPSEDAARIEQDVTGLCEDLRKRVYVDFITMEALFAPSCCGRCSSIGRSSRSRMTRPSRCSLSSRRGTR